MSSTDPNSGNQWEPPTVAHLHELLPQYEITEILGRGGMGAVYKGRQTKLARDVAIKVLPETFTRGDDEHNFTARFEQEAQAMANLDHPAILSVYDFGETAEGQLYFIMEFIDGMDIQQYLAHQGGRLSQDQALSITAHVLDALDYAHAHGVIHRDIKPANILLNHEGRVKIADFGLAKTFTDGGVDTAAPGLTMTNVALGTPDFVAPEALDGTKIADHRADLYAVGVMLYQMLTGSVPRGHFKLPSVVRPEIDPRLDEIVRKSLQTDPADRFSAASEVRAALEPIFTTPFTKVESGDDESGVRAVVPVAEIVKEAGVTPAGVPKPMEREKSKSPLFFGIGLAVLILIGVGIYALTTSTSKEDPKLADGGGGEKPPEVVPPKEIEPPTHPVPESPENPPVVPPIPPDPSPDFSPVNLFTHIDHESVQGLTSKDEILHCAPNTSVSVDFEPQSVAKDKEYVLDLVLTSKKPNGFRISLPVGDRRIHVPVDIAGADSVVGTRSLELFHKFSAPKNPTRYEYSETDLKVGAEVAHRLVLTVSGEKITLEIDGDRLLEWKGAVDDLEFDWNPEVNGLSMRGKPYFEFYGDYAIHRMQILPLGSTVKPLEMAQFSHPDSPVVSANPNSPTTEPGEKPTLPELPAPVDPSDPVAVRLAELAMSFKAKYDSDVEAPHADAVATLNTQFSGALKRAEDKASQTGKLETVMLFRSDRERISAGDGVPETDAEGTPESLVKLRATYRTQLAKLQEDRAVRAKPIFETYLGALTNYEEQLTRAKDIDGALRVKSFRENVSNEDIVVEEEVATAPPKNGPRGDWNPLHPVITEVPKRVYPPERPTRSGELIHFSADGTGEVKVVAEDVVAFRLAHDDAIMLKADGRLEKFGDGLPVVKNFESAAVLRDVVAFDATNGWGAALTADGNLTAFGAGYPEGGVPPKSAKFAEVQAHTHMGIGLTETGKVVSWPEGPDWHGFYNWMKDLRSVAQFRRLWDGDHQGIALTDRGKVEHGFKERSMFEKDELARLSRIRNAVRIAAGGMLVLLETGEIVPIGWPRDVFPDGNPLPPDMPRDIEHIYVGGYHPHPGKNQHVPIGAILSRSRGWIFVGEGIDAKALAEKARGCFQIRVVRTQIFGLRDSKE